MPAQLDGPVVQVFYGKLERMGKGKRDAYWQEHEQSADKIEKAKSKPLKCDRTKVWERACADYLAVNPFCHDCHKRGYTSPAEHVSHIQRPDQSPIKFWNINNWVALCGPCYQRITEGQPVQVAETIPGSAKFYTVK